MKIKNVITGAIMLLLVATLIFQPTQSEPVELVDVVYRPLEAGDEWTRQYRTTIYDPNEPQNSYNNSNDYPVYINWTDSGNAYAEVDTYRFETNEWNNFTATTDKVSTYDKYTGIVTNIWTNDTTLSASTECGGHETRVSITNEDIMPIDPYLFEDQLEIISRPTNVLNTNYRDNDCDGIVDEITYGTETHTWDRNETYEFLGIEEREFEGYRYHVSKWSLNVSFYERTWEWRHTDELLSTPIGVLTCDHVTTQRRNLTSDVYSDDAYCENGYSFNIQNETTTRETQYWEWIWEYGLEVGLIMSEDKNYPYALYQDWNSRIISTTKLPPLDIPQPTVTVTETESFTETEISSITQTTTEYNTVTDTDTIWVLNPPSTETVTEYANTTTETETVDQLVVTETEYGNVTEWNASANQVHINDGEINGSLPVPFTGWMYGLLFIVTIVIIRRRK